METDHIITIRRSLRWVFVVSLVALAALLIISAALKSFDGARAHVLNTLVALVVGALLADVHVAAYGKSPRWGRRRDRRDCDLAVRLPSMGVD